MPTGGLRYTDLIDYLNVCAKNDVTNNFAAGNMLDQSAGKEGGMLVVLGTDVKATLSLPTNVTIPGDITLGGDSILDSGGTESLTQDH